MAFAVPLLAALAAVLSYRFLEGGVRRSWDAVAGRAIGWAAVALLLLNLSCPAAAISRRPLVLLDASLSMQAAGGPWSEALALARREGTIRLVGELAADSTPAGGRSLLAPALTAVRGGPERVVVVTDGEIEDSPELPRDLLQTATIRVLPRRTAPDLALTRVDGPARLSLGDTLRLHVEVSAFGGSASRRVGVSARAGRRLWLRGSAEVPASGTTRIELTGPLPALDPGVHVLTVAIDSAGDGEPRDDSRLVLVSVAPTPGIVLLASPPTWESRFLLPVLRDVSGLPVRGYARTEPGRWRELGSLAPVAGQVVSDVARRADLVVTLGDVSDALRGSSPRAVWRWRAGTAAALDPGDWYFAAAEDGPLAGALAALPLDSFPPAAALTQVPARRGDWVALTAQLGRRGTPRAAMTGGDSAGVRRIDMAADGLWRWAFRGGSSEQAYRALVAGAAAWLLERGDSAGGAVRVLRPVVPRGWPLVFEHAAPGNPRPVGIRFQSGSTTRTDTLRFDGSGRAEVRLPPGAWSYQAGESRGLVAVEDFSPEWLPRPPTLAPQEGTGVAQSTRSPLRNRLWIFGVAVVGFALEWIARRRRGMR